MDWQNIKDKVYYLDGSLRDIYILGTTKEDWRKWTEFINTNYKVAFHIYETQKTTDKIDFSIVSDYWDGDRDKSCYATIYCENIKINTFFFSNEEIENDITPTEFNYIKDHNDLIAYLSQASKILNKQVIVTPENVRETALITVDKDEIKINL